MFLPARGRGNEAPIHLIESRGSGERECERKRISWYNLRCSYSGPWLCTNAIEIGEEPMDSTKERNGATSQKKKKSMWYWRKRGDDGAGEGIKGRKKRFKIGKRREKKERSVKTRSPAK